MVNVKKPTPRADAAAFGEEYLKKWDMLQECKYCKRKIRPSAQKAADWPVTTSYGGTRLCTSCVNNPGPAGVPVGRLGSPKPRLAPVSERNAAVAPREPRPGSVPKTRQQIVAEWSEQDRSVALLVCEYVTDTAEALDVIGSLGLFDDPVSKSYINGLALERIGRTPDRASGKKERIFRDE